MLRINLLLKDILPTYTHARAHGGGVRTWISMCMRTYSHTEPAQN
jgi:hypothetical protein